MHRIARKINLRLPSDTLWTTEYKRAKAMRDDLGHMLHFHSLGGASPNQSATLVRVPYGEPDEMTTDRGWARHRRIRITIAEREAREVLAGLSYVRESVFALRKFGIEFATRSDYYSTESVLDLMRWWLDDWGPRPGENGWAALIMGQLRIHPKAEFDASLPPAMQPEF